MTARGKARKRALDILFEAEMRGLDTMTLLRDRLPVAQPPIPEYAVELVEGVVTHRAAIDEVLTSYAIDWSLERMPPVDRNVLRLGAYELLYGDDVPDAVAVSEAVELVRALSTDESPRFVNGVLGRVLSEKPTLTARQAGQPAGAPTDDDPFADGRDASDE